jgi:hypothetical protein
VLEAATRRTAMPQERKASCINSTSLSASSIIKITGNESLMILVPNGVVSEICIAGGFFYLVVIVTTGQPM